LKTMKLRRRKNWRRHWTRILTATASLTAKVITRSCSKPEEDRCGDRYGGQQDLSAVIVASDDAAPVLQTVEHERYGEASLFCIGRPCRATSGPRCMASLKKPASYPLSAVSRPTVGSDPHEAGAPT
jgi:hypothetical protein